MQQTPPRRSLSMLALALACSGTAYADDSTTTQLREMLKAQQQQLNAQSQQLKALEAQLNATADQVSKQSEGLAWAQNTTIGGYGELHYNGGEKDEIDLHRFVLFVGHQFNERIRLFSEFEIEHNVAGEGQGGEVEIEQAYIEMDLNSNHSAKAGVFLIPVGILNETHEPPTFYGVERNPVETDIIPATWWEGGLATSGRLGHGLSYDLAAHSGLDTTDDANSPKFVIRKGRQKTSKAPAEDFAYTGRLRWKGVPGVEVSVTAQYQEDLSQNTTNTSAVLLETHVVVQRDGFGLRALYAIWDLDGNEAQQRGEDEQYGFYIEPSYRFAVPTGELGFFARYNQWDTSTGNDTTRKQVDTGLNFWPHPDVVLKADWQFQTFDEGAGNEDNRVNLGVGYQF